MSERDEKAILTRTLWQPLVDQWTECVEQVGKPPGPFPLPIAAADRDERRQWLAGLQKSSDLVLRSPEFLRQLKAHIDRLIAARGAHAEPNQGAADPSEMEQMALELTGRSVATTVWMQFLQRFSGATTRPTGCTPYQVVFDDGHLQLRRYGSQNRRFTQPVLICFALVNRPYVMDLRADRSVIRVLCDHGFDVYLIDWYAPSDDECDLSLDNYIQFLHTAVIESCAQASSKQLNLVGYCMGGTLSTMYASLRPEALRSLTLVATPIDFSRGDSLLQLWTRAEYFDIDGLIDAYGNCPGEFLNYCFLLMKPVQNIVEKYITFCERVDDSEFLDNFFAVEQWANDSVPVAGETFRAYVKRLYRDNELVRGTMTLSANPIQLGAITCPIQLLVAQKDHLVPASSSLALLEHLDSVDTAVESVDTGHIGLVISSKAHHHAWPAAALWMAERSTSVDVPT